MPFYKMALCLCIFSLYATPLLGMNESNRAWPSFANQTRNPWHHYNQHHWPYQHSAWPASGQFTQEHAWNFIKRINCQHHWGCPHYQSYSYGMGQGYPHCWQRCCRGYVPSYHGGEEHLGKIFAFGSVIMAISLYYLYKDLFPDRCPAASNDPDDQGCGDATPKADEAVVL